jgi:hypothetical protein
MALGRTVLLLALAVHGAAGADASAEVEKPPPRTSLDADSTEVRDAVRYVMTELKRLSNRYRYASLTEIHSAASGPANFDGRNLFLDLEFDMLRGQPSRHQIMVFKDEYGVITGIAMDEFPETELRERADPDV